ncbi:hypothetical protein [Rhizobium sp. R693]|uniref:hypothetical protein n=1 Tax=Rhizobium sp. R693 TaxID=1764276 RepID=UPI000B529923|nr:hypothetical protein [Rhizobium sp. R693]OWV84596.1 hypothetical protein ATY79_11820 [Rhizobium sp. R693]
MEISIGKMEGTSLKALAQGGDSNLSLSKQQVKEWATSTTRELGGCENLRKLHNAELKAWQ